MVRLNCELVQQTAINLGHDQIRIIAWWDTQTNGTASNMADVLVSTAGDGIEYDSFRNLFRGTRFKIIFDKTYFFNSNSWANENITTTTDGLSARVIKKVWFYKDMAVPISYAQETPSVGAIASVQENSLWLAAISKHDRVSIQGRIRIRYTG